MKTQTIEYCSDNALYVHVFTYVLTYICRGDELLLTEMIFNGAFNDLTIEQCVSLLSCFVFQEKVCDCIMLPVHTVSGSIPICNAPLNG